MDTGKRGPPPHVLPEGVRVRIKNKGSQNHKRGRKRLKYQAPQREYPDTDQDLPLSDIHANHVEAQNAAEEETAHSDEKPILTQRQQKDFNEPWIPIN